MSVHDTATQIPRQAVIHTSRAECLKLVKQEQNSQLITDPKEFRQHMACPGSSADRAHAVQIHGLRPSVELNPADIEYLARSDRLYESNVSFPMKTSSVVYTMPKVRYIISLAVQDTLRPSWKCFPFMALPHAPRNPSISIPHSGPQ